MRGRLVLRRPHGRPRRADRRAPWGEIPGYTATRLPVELVYATDFPTRDEALRAERQVKRWSRAKKEALIRGDWDGLRALARNPQDQGSSSASR